MKTLVYLQSAHGAEPEPQLWHDHNFTLGGKPIEVIYRHDIPIDLEHYPLSLLTAWYPCPAPSAPIEAKVKL